MRIKLFWLGMLLSFNILLVTLSNSLLDIRGNCVFCFNMVYNNMTGYVALNKSLFFLHCLIALVHILFLQQHNKLFLNPQFLSVAAAVFLGYVAADRPNSGLVFLKQLYCFGICPKASSSTENLVIKIHKYQFKW